MLNKTLILVLIVFIITGCQATAVPVEPSLDDEQPVPNQSPSEATETSTNDLLDTAGTETVSPSVVNQATEEIEENEEDGTMEARTADADVEFVRAVLSPDGTWTFSVTVRHPDMGWEDYANGWDVTTLDGTVLKVNASDPFTRLLLHPHENEQPFTRSQSNIVIPEGVTQVIVRAHDLVDGYGGQEIKVDVSSTTGPGYEVERQK